MPEDLDALLNGYQAGTLNEMIAAAGLEAAENGRPLPKSTAVERVRKVLLSKGRIREAWRSLDNHERRVLNRLLLYQGEVSTRGLKRALLRASVVAPTPTKGYRNYGSVSYATGYIGSPRRAKSAVFEDVIARLTLHALVFSRSATAGWSGPQYKVNLHPGSVLVVPEVVRDALPRPEPLPRALAGWQAEEVESRDPDLLLRDLYLYWDRVRHTETPLLQSGYVSKRWLKAVNDLLLVRDDTLDEAKREDETRRLYLLRQLLHGMRLLRSSGAAAHTTGDPLIMPAAWQMAPIALRAACLALWPQLEERFEGRPDLRPMDLMGGKRALLKALASAPVGDWLTPEELLERAWEGQSDGLLPERVSYGGSYYGSSSGYADDAARPGEEGEGDLRFVDACLGGLLLEIGLVELGVRAGERHGFRLTGDAPALLRPPRIADAGEPETEPLPTTPAGGSVVVQPNFQVLAIGPVPLYVLARLDTLASRERADRGAFVYHLSRESVYGAQQLGMSAQEVERFLREVTGAGLPQNVARSLEEWGAHHERIVFREGVSLLQVADAALLEGLTQEDAIRRLGLRALTPEVALVRGDRQDRLIPALVARGHLPAISSLRPESADKSVLIAPDGTIAPIHAVPSLYLRDRLAGMAEEMGDGRWRLTPRSVARAGGSKARVLRLLGELNTLQRGKLPDGLEDAIRTWGGYYGAVAVQALTLVELHDQETLDELLQRPELRGALFPLAPGRGKRALAVIAEGRREHVEEVLRRLGVRIEGAILRQGAPGASEKAD